MNCLVDWNPFLLLCKSFLRENHLVGNLVDYLKRIFCSKMSPQVEKIFFLCGAVSLTLFFFRLSLRILSITAHIAPHVLKQTRLNGQNMKNKYGECYVLITGASDGIGFAFAQLFAEYGFNLILISRNEEKLVGRVKELKEEYEVVDIKHIICDLSSTQHVSYMLTQLGGLAKSVDIGIVINNAGTVKRGQFISLPNAQIQSELQVNVESMIEINKMLIPILQARPNRSAILNVSSCTGPFLASNISVYSSSKLMMDIYTRTLQAEQVKDKTNLEVMSLLPFGVTTKMMNWKKGPLMITPRECATAAISDLLGGTLVSFGSFKHKMCGIAFNQWSVLQRFQQYEKWQTPNRK